MKLSKGKCEVLHLRRNKPRHWYTLGTNWLGRSSSEKNLGGPGGQQCTLGAKKASSILGCVRRSIAIAIKLSELILALCSALVTHLECCVQF